MASGISVSPLYLKHDALKSEFCKKLFNVKFNPKFEAPLAQRGKESFPFHQPSFVVYSQNVSFEAKKTVKIPVLDRKIPVTTYLSRTERIVGVAFPDKSRIMRLDSELWRVNLKPVTFFTISATPVCDLRCWFDNETLRLFSNKVILDLAGLPSQYQHIDLRLNLSGQLYKNQTKDRTKCTLDGSVEMILKFDLPLPFSLMPETMVKVVGDTILDNILQAMQGALLRGLVNDYYEWSIREEKTQKSVAESVVDNAVLTS